MIEPGIITPKTLDDLRAWGGPRELSAFEAMMWLAEADPHLRSTTTSVMILDSAPNWDRFIAGHDWMTRAAVRLRHRVVEPLFGLEMPCWVDDPEFLLDYHVRRVRLPESGTDRQLFDLAQTLAMTPFDRFRPPWEATLVEGLHGGRAAYILKLHHAISDGIGIMQLMTDALSTSTGGRTFPPLKIGQNARRPQSRLDLAMQGAMRRFLELPHESRDTVSTVLTTLVDWLSKPGALREACNYLVSARRMLATKPVAGSPILKKRSLGTRFDGFEVALSDLKTASKSVGSTLNDLFLAGLIGGFRRYHEKMGVKLATMPIGFPISLRVTGDAAGGNKFAGAQYAAPINERDPMKRVEHIKNFVGRVRSEPALGVVLKIAPIMVRLPTPILTSIAANMTAAQDAQISNIPGISRPMYMAGAEVTHYWPFAPTVGCGMMISMVSHNGRCCVGINSDRAAVTQPDLMATCLQEGLEEMLALRAPRGRNATASARRVGKLRPKEKLSAKTQTKRAIRGGSKSNGRKGSKV